jgi:hypothetical protein
VIISIKALLTEERRLEILDRQAIEEYKHLHPPGSFHRLTVEPWQEKRSEEAFRYFHKIRDRYATALGYNMEYAKKELKYMYGINVPYGERNSDGKIITEQNFLPPKWGGQFVEIYDEIVFQKSTLEYTVRQMAELTMGAKNACYENHIDISDLEEPRETLPG